MHLAAVSTHPIQYLSPLYRVLSQDVATFSVAYLGQPQPEGYLDSGFGRRIRWDVSLRSDADDVYFGVPDVLSGPSIRDLWVIYRQALDWLRTIQPDVLLVPGWTPVYLPVVVAAGQLSVGLICRPEARPAQGGFLRQMGHEFVVRRFLRQMDAVAAIGTLARDELLRLGGEISGHLPQSSTRSTTNGGRSAAPRQ